MNITEGVAIFGSGTFAVQVIDLLEHSSVRVHAVVDRMPDRIGRPLSGTGWMIEDVSSLRRLDGIPVVLGILNPQGDIQEIGESLVRIGVQEIITPLQLWALLRGDDVNLVTHYWLAGSDAEQLPEPGSERHAAVEHARSLLLDLESRRLFDNIIEWRRDGNWRSAPACRSPKEQYGSLDVPLPRDSISFVDLGAYTGDTLEALPSLGFSFRRVWAFEPDPANYDALANTMRTQGLTGCALPLAATSQTEQIRFYADGRASAHRSSNGETLVQGVSLDLALNGEEVDYVKMDIEGAEMEALMGMERLIRNQQPALAVSVYHRPSDLWEIPLWLSNLNVGYDFLLRAYGHQTFDTVLYAIKNGARA